jgi:hypothetical protein
MPLDTRLPLLAGQFKPLTYQAPSQANMLAEVAQAASAMQGLQRNAMAMQAERAAREQENALAEYVRGGGAPEGLAQFGAPGARAMQQIQYGQQVAAQTRGVQQKEVEAAMGQFMSALGRTQNAQQARSVLALGFQDPLVSKAIGRFTTPEQAMAGVPDDPAQFNDWLRTQVLAPAERFKERTGAQRYISSGQGRMFDTQTGLYVDMPAAEAPATTGVAAPVAPAPQGRNRYITAGGAVYDTVDKKWLLAPEKTGVGVGGATSGAAPRPMTALQQQRLEEQSNARQTLSEELATVLGYYEDLEKQKAMVSTGRAAGENVIAAARATGVGQTVERAIGTQAQTLRDNIANSKFRLIRHIAAITGASSKTMDSNRELQNWLDAMTNVGQSIQTVRETLGRLDQVIASVRGQQEREDAATGRQTAPAPTPAPAARSGAPAPAPVRTGGARREIAPGVFVTERP